MKKNKKRMRKLFLTHLGIVVPVLITSMLMTFYISHEMLKIEEEMIERQITTAEDWLTQEYEKIEKKSILLAQQPQLRKNKMLEGKYGTLEGVEFLELQKNIDQGFADIFVTYGDEKVYASSGVSSWYNYFRYVRGMTESSVDRGIAALEKEDSFVCFLQDTVKKKYFLYSMESKKKNNGNMKVNFIVSAQELEALFKTQYNSQYFELEAADGTVLYISCDENGKISFPDFEDWNKQLSWKSLGKKECAIENINVNIKFYYDRSEFFINQWLMRVQITNWLIFMIGSVFTAYLSWKYSKKQIYEIAYLEYAVEGNEEYLLPEYSAYKSLQKKILDGYGENKILEKRFQEESNKLKDKITLMIFEGVYRNQKSINDAFLELGYKGFPKRFFVGMIHAKEHILLTQLPLYLKECLNMYVNVDNQEALVFLKVIDSLDENHLERRQFAEKVRDYLHKHDLSKVSISMSRVYEDPMLIERAYREAWRSLNDILNGRYKDFWCCWENSDAQLMGVLFEKEKLECFEDALYSNNLELAKASFQQLLEVMASAECTLQNRFYLRYEILQCLMNFLKTTEIVEKAVLMRECVNADITRERDFMRTVLNILQRCLVEKEDDKFTRMLNYVNSNYQNFSLSVEEVAEVGGISKNYVSKVFRSHLNMSYIEYVTMVRMDKARTLLRTTDLKINDIAEQVGYMNTVSFRRAFREKYGENASQYRKNEGKYKLD